MNIMKLKNIFKVSLLSLVLSSCGEDFLSVTPSDQLSSDSFWTSESDATQALAACYADWEGYMNIAYFDTGSDNAYQKNNFVYERFGFGTLSASAGTAYVGLYGNWVDAKAHCWFKYTKIRWCNNFLVYVPDIDMDETLKKEYIAEVRFLRAYDYFNKIMLYGDMPLVTDVISAEESLMTRTPMEDIVDFIYTELDECAPDLPEENINQTNGHVTRGAAYALKARLELYLGDYAAAMISAKKVIDMSCFELYNTGNPESDYQNLFLEGTEGIEKESIMVVKYDATNDSSYLTQLMPPQGQADAKGYNSIEGTWDMMEAYQTLDGKDIFDADSGYEEDNPFVNRDPRLAQTWLYPGAFYFDTGYQFDPLSYVLADGTSATDNYFNSNTNGCRSGITCIKHIEPVSLQANYGCDIIVFRLAEMYLIYAECAARTGQNTDTALTLINKIRARAGMPNFTTLDLDEVLRERRVELCIEGFRYFDIKRMDLGATELSGMMYGTYYGNTGDDNEITVVSADADGNPNPIVWDKSKGRRACEELKFIAERNYLMPIPQTELDANPNMTQNPGY